MSAPEQIQRTRATLERRDRRGGTIRRAATAAIAGLHGQGLGGRDMVVNIAKPMEARAPRAGGFGGNRF